ncbi:MAG TPA: lytic murein transglycosylase [Acetobacteraceae bacterium]|nr:lytic murein transglycosylase [Acetobacteraceae bacterium]
MAAMLNRRTLALSAALLPFAAHAQPGEFDAFVAGVKSEARRMGIRESTLQAAFAGVAPNQRVIELDRRQPETTMTWPEYRARVLPDARIQLARENYARERRLLAAVEQRFGVDGAIIVGIWGIESGFGANRGNYRLVEALSTLAWEGRRAAFFRKELMNALRILDAGDVTPARLTGSYAGAMGQPQFMPSSYLTYAVDFDGDGKRDIWESRPDIFASVANYLSRNGWRHGQPWIQPVRVPPEMSPLGTGRGNKRALGEWMRQGVTRTDGRPFSRTDVPGELLLPTGADAGEGYIAYANGSVVRSYNPPDFYILAVGLLANAARG